MTSFLSCHGAFSMWCWRGNPHWVKSEGKTSHYVWNIGFASLCAFNTIPVGHKLPAPLIYRHSHSYQLMAMLRVVLASFLSVWLDTWTKQLTGKKGLLSWLLDLRFFMRGTRCNIVGSTRQRKLFFRKDQESKWERRAYVPLSLSWAHLSWYNLPTQPHLHQVLTSSSRTMG